MRSIASALLIFGNVLLACSDSTAPTAELVAGSYTAETFNTADGGVVTDQLALGASIQVTLAADHSTTGRLFVPNGDEGGGDLDMDLAGTWTLEGDSVEFEHVADTFLRDMTFSYANGKLTGDATFSDVMINVVLSK